MSSPHDDLAPPAIDLHQEKLAIRKASTLCFCLSLLGFGFTPGLG
ncbi:hypothetical protein [Phormidium yuhuli]|nr:hypothetical protein [Phormidium yuhuli]